MLTVYSNIHNNIAIKHIILIDSLKYKKGKKKLNLSDHLFEILLLKAEMNNKVIFFLNGEVYKN